MGMEPGCPSVRIFEATALCLIAGPAAASTSTVAVLTGDCSDPSLVSNGKRLVTEMEKAGGLNLHPPEMERLLGADPEKNVDELQSQLDSAQMLYYQGEYTRAERMARLNQLQISHLPPGADHWKLEAASHLLVAQVTRGLGRQADSDEELRRVLRIEPEYKMDPDYFSPSTRRNFDKLRAEIAAEKRFELTIRSGAPGAEVFIDGRRSGTTPTTLSLPSGSYDVSLSKGAQHSLTHKVSLKNALTLTLDMPFESIIRRRQPLCISNEGGEPARLNNAVKLGALFSAELVVVIRLDRQLSGRLWLVASLIEMSTLQKVREGGLKSSGEGDTPQGLAELADFILTGRHGSSVITDKLPEPPPPPTAEPLAVKLADAPKAAVPPLQTEQIATSVPDAALSAPPPGDRRNKPLGYGLGAGGVVALAIAAGLGVASNNSWNEFQGYYVNGQLPSQNIPLAHDAQTRATSEQNAAYVAVGVGVVAIGAGVYFAFLRR
jgi:hypothetical protein